ncbi:MAG: TlpA disulfide reductase family protein [Gemmatimonas sp.]
MNALRTGSALMFCAALLATLACDRAGGDDGAVRIAIGAKAPSYAAHSLAGDSVSLGGLRDKVVLLNVWATWCHPCRTEIPELQELHTKYASRGLAVIGVSIDSESDEENIRQFMTEFGMTYPVWRDPGERVSARFLVLGVPTTYLIDRGGILRWRMTGPIRPGDTTLVNAIETALAP